MEFNTLVDDALPLEGVITPDPTLKKLLEDMDKTRIKLWAFTNAYVSHAKRVLRLLGVEGLFEGVTYCDYAQWPVVCKPMGEMFEKAEREAGVGAGQYFFVGMRPETNFSPPLHSFSRQDLDSLFPPTPFHLFLCRAQPKSRKRKEIHI